LQRCLAKLSSTIPRTAEDKPPLPPKLETRPDSVFMPARKRTMTTSSRNLISGMKAKLEAVRSRQSPLSERKKKAVPHSRRATFSGSSEGFAAQPPETTRTRSSTVKIPAKLPTLLESNPAAGNTRTLIAFHQKAQKKGATLPSRCRAQTQPELTNPQRSERAPRSENFRPSIFNSHGTVLIRRGRAVSPTRRAPQSPQHQRSVMQLAGIFEQESTDNDLPDATLTMSV